MKLEDLLKETFDYIAADDFDPKLIFVISKFIGSVIELNTQRLMSGQKLLSLVEAWNQLNDEEKNLLSQTFSPKGVVLFALLCFIFTSVTASHARIATLESMNNQADSEEGEGKKDETDESSGVN